MQKRAQIEVFGHFIEFCWLDWSDIANDDSAKCFSTFVDVSRPFIYNHFVLHGFQSIASILNGPIQTHELMWNLNLFPYSKILYHVSTQTGSVFHKYRSSKNL